MQVLRLAIILGFLVQSICPIEEVMTAKIQLGGEDILGSFTVKPSTGDVYSGIIFGRVEGDKIKANYLTVKSSQVSITFTDAKLVDQNTIKGTYYVQDSDMNAISGPYVATRE
jgi:hypothetical protein